MQIIFLLYVQCLLCRHPQPKPPYYQLHRGKRRCLAEIPPSHGAPPNLEFVALTGISLSVLAHLPLQQSGEETVGGRVMLHKVPRTEITAASGLLLGDKKKVRGRRAGVEVYIHTRSDLGSWTNLRTALWVGKHGCCKRLWDLLLSQSPPPPLLFFLAGAQGCSDEAKVLGRRRRWKWKLRTTERQANKLRRSSGSRAVAPAEGIEKRQKAVRSWDRSWTCNTSCFPRHSPALPHGGCLAMQDLLWFLGWQQNEFVCSQSTLSTPGFK